MSNFKRGSLSRVMNNFYVVLFIFLYFPNLPQYTSVIYNQKKKSLWGTPLREGQTICSPSR